MNISLKLFFLITTAAVLSGGGFAGERRVAAQRIPAPKKDAVPADVFAATVSHNGAKTEIAGTQFETFGGNASALPGGGMMFFMGGSNPKDDRNFSFNASIPRLEKGTYGLGDGATIGIATTAFPGVPFVVAKSLALTVESMPLPGGIVEGSFEAVFVNVLDDGTTEEYAVSGRFTTRRAN